MARDRLSPLETAWGSLRSWYERMPHSSRTPISFDLLRALFIWGWAYAAGPPGRRDARLVYVLLVLARFAFFALLRPGELGRLRVGDLRFHQLQSGAWSLVASVRRPKNRKTFAKVQFVVVHDQATIAWMWWLVQGLPTNTAWLRLTSIGLDPSLQ